MTLFLLLCGKADEPGSVDSEGMCRFSTSSAAAQQWGIRSNWFGDVVVSSVLYLLLQQSQDASNFTTGNDAMC